MNVKQNDNAINLSILLILVFVLTHLLYASVSRSVLSTSVVGLVLACSSIVAVMKHKHRLLEGEIERVKRALVEAFADQAEQKDTYTAQHLKRITLFTTLLTKEMQRVGKFCKTLTPHFRKDIILGSMLHDVGKIVVPNEILNKPGKLTDEEYAVMKQHTIKAGELIGKICHNLQQKEGEQCYLTTAQQIALYHHERYDGKGYPAGLSGEGIPLAARIVGLVDTYDAIRSKRSYKETKTHQDAVQEILKERGKQFDADIVDAFMRIEKQFEGVQF